MDSSTLACVDAANSIRNAMRVFRKATQQDGETINHLRDQLKSMSEKVSLDEWESLYDSREEERAKRKAAEARLAKIETHIMESNYYGGFAAPRGAAKVLHEVFHLANPMMSHGASDSKQP